MSLLTNNPVILILSILLAVNLVLTLFLLMRQQQSRREHQALFEGIDGKSVEVLLAKQKKQLDNHQKNLKELGEILAELVEQNKLTVQKVGLVRYNPFADTGSDLSFAIALLDGLGSGIVISSLHSREGTRIYAKAIEKGESKHHLTEEEKEAIKKAEFQK